MLGKSAPRRRDRKPIGRCYGVIVARQAMRWIGSCYLPRVNARIESGRCVLIPQMYNPASLPVFHMSGELFKMMVGIDVPHVPYSDADADRSARRSGAGHLQHMPELIGHLSSGRLRLLAVLK